LFDAVLSRGGVHEATTDGAWLQAMLDAEAALARANAAAGLIGAEDAEAIAAACHADAFDVDAIGAAAVSSGSPVVPLVRALTAAVGEPAAAQVHRGATSQDILDTASMLVASRALPPLLDDLWAAADATAKLARHYRDTPAAGRTLLQHAVPVTFGLKAAGWLVGLDDVCARLDHVRRTRLAVQLGGAAGTLAALGSDGMAVVGHLARELGLAEPVVPWHTQASAPRSRAMSSCCLRRRSGRSVSTRKVVAARQPCPTSATPSRRWRSSPRPRAPQGWCRPC
jgi:3-carboxy-cis,cis-muconate cycloisomerase